ncbi:sensor histidine kinase [Microbispora sp. CA-135349]|uniref:sensor histidine kinase n=1 Tax=Microbispora sp. CA-135349 TaxID=3239953 RepID=UPI003D92E2A9
MDAMAFASLAEPALQTGQTDGVRSALARYTALYDNEAALVNRDGRLVLYSGGGTSLPDAARGEVDGALAGMPSGPAGTIWPWTRRPLVVAVPVTSGGDVVGALSIISPTGPIRRLVLLRWGLLTTGGLMAAAMTNLVARRLVEWILRPVHYLDAAAQELSHGSLAAHTPLESGPPELRQLVKKFNFMAEAVRGIIDRERRFASYAGHQLRTPLAALQLQLENLQMRLPLSDAGLVEPMMDEVDRLAGICADLVEFARGRSADCTNAGTSLLEAVAARADAWDVVVVSSPSEEVLVNINESRLGQVLDILLDNAFKYGGAGNAVSVTVDLPANGAVVVHVVDAGPGIPSGARERAVEPFWRAPDVQNLPGSGLGLAIAVSLLRDVGGEVELRAAVPRGLDAAVLLPLAGA